MAQRELQNGDLVQLKSGGPVMTLGDFASGNNFYCHWFDKDGVFHSEKMTYLGLILVESTDSKE